MSEHTTAPAGGPSGASIAPIELRCEYLQGPIGIDVVVPRLSWVLEGQRRGARQTAYRIEVRAGTEPGAGVWDSGRVESGTSVHVEYRGPVLESRRRYVWTVTVWDEDGAVAVSQPSFWEMGLLAREEWGARWIGLGNAGPFGAPLKTGGTRPRTAPSEDNANGPDAGTSEDTGSAGAPDGDDAPRDSSTHTAADVTEQTYGERRPCPYLRTSFDLDRPWTRARVYATARGLYELRLNGEPVSDARLAPGWTDYHQRIQYQTYDVTDRLRLGENALGAVLGTGWYAGYLGFDPRWRAFRYGYRPSLLLRLEVWFEDGEVLELVSDDAWTSSTGSATFADLLLGEAHDARLEPHGWDQPGFDDAHWERAEVDNGTDALLVAQVTPPIRVTEELAARSLSEPSPGVHLFDFGQNMVGWARLHASGPAGTVVRLRFGETVSADGTLYTENLRTAKQTDVFVLSGSGRETFEPRFTFHGFRYVEVAGLVEPPAVSDLIGCVLHDDLAHTGSFTSSSPLLNKLHENVRWSQRGNFISVPTDCPQRDERMGWLGDAQVFVRTASYSMAVAAFFTKWLEDVVDAQGENGAFPDVAPRTVLPSDGAPGWGDAGVIVPWSLYQMYGDVRLLERLYQPMQRWMEYLAIASPGHLRTRRLNMNFGDWLSLDAETPKEVLATAYYALDARLMARIARVLGHAEDERRYAALFDDIRAAFQSAYVGPAGEVYGDTQTAYLLALHAGLVPDGLRSSTARLLVADIDARGGHLSTGFLGVGLLGPVLTDAGYSDVAYRLALAETYPSWGYSIRHGATSMWERWDGWTEDRGFQTPAMNSFNHYAFGSIGEWLYRYVAGIDVDPERPGFEHVVLRPLAGGGLHHAGATYRSVRGEIRSRWEFSGDDVTYRVTVPANVSATLHVPTSAPELVTENGRPADEAVGVTRVAGGADEAVFELASGIYAFLARSRVSPG